MKFKDGVITQVTTIVNGKAQLNEPTAETLFFIQLTDRLSHKVTGKEIVVTSLLDGKHMTGSLHYQGKAFDIRTSVYTKAETARLIAALRQFDETLDIVDEGDHIHIEIDPKNS